jgi:AraC-like DNA-binding protein/mannose-6-phosphate isomerase-like protein (cupin superfamily)
MFSSFPKYLHDFPNRESSFPFHIAVHKIRNNYPRHRHDFLEFSFVLEGKGEEIVNGKCHSMQPGTFTFISPYQIHEIYAERGSTLQLINCIFGHDLISEREIDRFLLYDDSNIPAYVQFNREDTTKTKLILDEMQQEYLSNHVWKNTILKAKLLEVLILFLRRRGGCYVPSFQSNISPTNIIWGIMQYISNNYQEKLTLGQLSEHFHLSASYLSELFKQQVGTTFVSYLHEVRIRHACTLLVSTSLSVADIAMEVGFGSFKTFSRVFRQNKAMTPTEYRKSVRKV